MKLAETLMVRLIASRRSTIYKTGFTILTSMLAVFAIGHVRAFVTHGQLDCSTAAAQGWSDGSGDSADSGSDEDSAEPDMHKAPPPDIEGEWSGEIEDLNLGDGNIGFDFIQNGKKLKGPWDSDFGGKNFTGSINSAGEVKLKMKVSGGCHLSAVGVLVLSDEIDATYKVQGCKANKHDHGSFQIFD